MDEMQERIWIIFLKNVEVIESLCPKHKTADQLTIVKQQLTGDKFPRLKILPYDAG